jgi:hypothetical protein
MDDEMEDDEDAEIRKTLYQGGNHSTTARWRERTSARKRSVSLDA